MARTTPRALVEANYYQAAQAYLRSLPLEHFVEATPQATQRKITLESLDLVVAARNSVHLYNELLVQYRLGRDKAIRQVVPDNMVVLHEGPLQAETSYDVELQPARPFWVLEYVSKNSKRKDYEESFDKYEKELKVPYYLVFYPDNQELTLYRRGRARYSSVKPNEWGRLAIPELELELALLDGWVRFWFRGELLPLPAELQAELEETRQQLEEVRQRAEQEHQRAEEARQLAEKAQQQAVEERQRAEEERQRAEEAQQRAEEEHQRAGQEGLRADREKQQRHALEQEVARLRTLLERQLDSPT